MLNEHLESFLKHITVVKQLSPHTIKNYKRDLTQFAKFLEKEITEWKEVQKHNVRDYINKERRRGLNPRSLQRILSSFINIKSSLTLFLSVPKLQTNFNLL